MRDGILPDRGRSFQWRPGTGGIERLEEPACKRNPELHALGRAIRELRARRGLSQEQLAAESGLHRNYVGAMERGEINPTFRVLRKLVIGLDVSLCELVETHERQKERLGRYRPSPLIARTDDR